ncbi:hypothetical protein M3204_21595 [Mesobacillus subterraneus]|uniref:hypothetical protein n=1 Tax=Mesobacillus subterraneus TaxID=285983 RepID=UPI00203AC6DD|nr:hypothetical protein [Mesobacillus subterraneus]MCM3667000.1 hypothetical protein [Mesobacillus subterraneus]MCM3685831.1 hypothetical protein [Mesobacillus subterraneus]
MHYATRGRFRRLENCKDILMRLVGGIIFYEKQEESFLLYYSASNNRPDVRKKERNL